MANELDLSQCLSNTLVFQGLSRSQLAPILDIAQLKTFGKGELLFNQGSQATGFFVVKSGRVKVFNVSPAGKEQILSIFEAGDNFAEVAALDGQTFPASAAALDPAELIFFPRKEFLDVIYQNPDIAVNTMVSLSKHLRQLTAVIEELSFKDVPQRLAAYLLNLSPAPGENRSDSASSSDVVTLSLTKSQLAAALGTIPATLSRALYRLSTEGLIAVNGPQIELLDRDRLERWSQSLESESAR
jgi:CRP/FNR family transcriptional regulator, dissimilatory nitrate respiration regulator